MTQTISDKFDRRPDWVKAILNGGYKVTAFLDGDSGRWYFKPTEMADERPVGYSVNVYKNGQKTPSIWTGEKWLDMRTDEGKKLYFETKSVRDW
jgi:hypothetical protein